MSGLRKSGEAGALPADSATRERNRRSWEKHGAKYNARKSAQRIAARRADPEKIRATDRERYAQSPRVRERTVAARKVRVANETPEQTAERLIAQTETHMWRKFKRTLADYDRVLGEQGGGCGSCGREPFETLPNGTVRRLAWDHDHSCCPGIVTCGECVRGLVCTGCNLIIGKIELGQFDPQVAYLEKWSEG